MTYTKEGYILNELYNKYYNYYCYCQISYIIQAIKETLKDGVNSNDIDAIHKHIKENYI